jgi:hypothetical protein
MDEKKKKSPAPKSMDELFAEYIATLSDVDGERRYWSHRKYARTVFENFQNWLEERKKAKKE